MSIKLLIFDFDGTLVDTRNLILKIVRTHLGKFNYALTKEALQKFGDTPLEKFIETIGVEKKIIKIVSKLIKRDFFKEYNKVKACKNLDKIKKIKKRKIILSDNTKKFITESLEHLKLNFFDDIYGADDFKNKTVGMKKIIRKYKLNPKEVVYIGDRVVGVRVSKDVGCFSVVVYNKCSWGNKKDLLEANPDFIINDLKKLKKNYS